MKKMVLTLALVLVGAAAMAQNCIVVNSEKVFKSIAAYNTAIEELDNLAKNYQEWVDAKFEEVEKLYNSYQQQKSTGDHNPNNIFDASDICYAWQVGAYILYYDKTQKILNCDAMLD